MFITAVDEKEIIDMVHKCKIKVSTDWDEINMTTVTSRDGIAKPVQCVQLRISSTNPHDPDG